jgi:hypothetical protein
MEWSGWNVNGVMPLWTCPERWTTAERNFRPHDPIGWLGVPMDFMNSTGVLCPSELCGLSQLYSCLNVSHFSLASATDKNQF